MSYTRKTADIFISDELLPILEKIQTQSIVAKLLLKKRHSLEDLVENHVNHISVSTDDKTKISYMTKERLMSGIDPWDSKRRFMIKPGAFVRKIFKNISDKDVELFASLYKSQQVQNDFEFKIVRGGNISDYYDQDSYASTRSSLGASCMRYEECQKYFDIYTQNQDVISMLVLVNKQGDLIGRSLLWESTDTKVMDRIYTINDDLFCHSFKSWAKENGYIYKVEQKWNNTFGFFVDGIATQKMISFKLENVDFEYYPYLDTFKFLSRSKKTIYNYIPTDVDDIVTITSADGCAYSSDYLSLDVKTKLYHQRCDTIYLPYLNGRVFGDDVHYSQSNDCYIHYHDSLYSEVLDDHIFADQSLNSIEGMLERFSYTNDEQIENVDDVQRLIYNECY